MTPSLVAALVAAAGASLENLRAQFKKLASHRPRGSRPSRAPRSLFGPVPLIDARNSSKERSGRATPL